mmetsp:Transcript_20261/g.37612  ORF Transcript_20261/g.37612 Transcript_20261/m.37612 type:complete len:114 (+) Transcript_20261:21-362(+)
MAGVLEMRARPLVERRRHVCCDKECAPRTPRFRKRHKEEKREPKLPWESGARSRGLNGAAGMDLPERIDQPAGQYAGAQAQALGRAVVVPASFVGRLAAQVIDLLRDVGGFRI